MSKKIPLIKASRANRPRNAFDLSQKHLFTAHAGMLLPVMTMDLIPNDHVSIQATDFMRCLPMNSAAFMSMRSVYEFFFVPYSQLWHPFDQFITGMNDYRSSVFDRAYTGHAPSVIPSISRQSIFESFFLPATSPFKDNIVGAFGANKRQKRAIQNQWAMFEAQKQHQNEVNERAMAFQREMNQRNEDWNNEVNVRERIEAAGYNPYLYNNGAMSANVNQSTPLAQNVAPTSPVDLPDPFSEFAHSAIDSVKGIADILLTKQNTRNIAANAANQEYMLGRQKYKDSQKYAGYDLPTAEAQLTHTQLEDARQLMIKDTVEANLAIMTENISKSLAFDENDQPITDESGRQLMLKEVSDRSLLKSNEKLLDKIKAEIRGINEESDLTKVKRKIEQFNLDNIAPAQVKEIYATIDRIQSEIIQKKAAAEFIGEQSETERVKRTGEVISSGIKAKDYKYYELNKLGKFGSNLLKFIPKSKGMAAMP